MQAKIITNTGVAWRTAAVPLRRDGRIAGDAHKRCDRCGADLFFGKVSFKAGDKWVCFSLASTGGGGYATAVKHVCKDGKDISEAAASGILQCQ